MTIKKLTFLLAFFSSILLQAQYQSRIISEVNSNNARANTLEYDDENLLIIFNYENDEGELGLGIMKTDDNGNPVWITKIDSLYAFSKEHTVFEENGTIIIAGHRSDGIFDKNIQFIKLDENGNTLEVAEYGEGWEEEQIRCFSSYFDGFLFSFDAPSVTNPDKSEPVLVRLDSNFEVVWEKQFTDGISSIAYYISRIWHDEEGNIYTGGSDGGSLSNATVMVKLDSDGNEIWKYTHMPLNRQVRGGIGIQLKDEDVFYLVNYVEEEISPVGHWHWVPEVIKINYEGEVIWSNLILNQWEKSCRGIFERENGDYIAYGRSKEGEYSSYRGGGWFVAYNQENERLFQRTIFDERFSVPDNLVGLSFLNAGAELPDGSLAFVGGIQMDNTMPFASNQVWFVHTDSEGCIEPNCGFLQIIDEDGNYSTTTATEDIQQNSTNPLSVKIYPNPVQDVLSIELLGEQPQLNKLELTDLTGKVLQNYSIQNQNNFTLNLPQDIKGIYFLKGHTDVGIWTKKVIVE